MVYSNAKGETLRTRGSQAKGKRDPDSNECERTRPASRADGSQSVGIDRAHRQGTDSFGCWSGGIVTGGILVQLIEESQQELVECEVRSQKIRDRLQLLKTLLDRLEKPED